jgi:tRNA dimethylallyltransferase
VVRALERAMIHGDRPPPPPRGYPARSVWIGQHVDAAENARRIEERARAQFTGGLLEEAAALRQRYDPSLPAFSAVGYREAFAVLDGILTTDQAIELSATRTRQLARRQRTWFHAELDIHWLDTTADLVADAMRLVHQGR